MRHKTPAVVQHGSKAAPLDQGQIAYENNVMASDENTAISCEENGGIKMDNEEAMVTQPISSPLGVFLQHEVATEAKKLLQPHPLHSTSEDITVICRMRRNVCEESDQIVQARSREQCNWMEDRPGARPPQSHLPYDNISMAQAVMSVATSEDIVAKSSVAYGSIDGQVCTAQGHPPHEGMPEGMPIMAQVVSIATRTDDIAKNGKDVWLCVHCGGTFGEKGNLARHIRIVHDKVKEHACAECGKAFGQKGDLVKHIKTIHDMERAFNCPVCSKQFSEKGNMTRHMRTVHKTEEKPPSKKHKGDQAGEGQEAAGGEGHDEVPNAEKKVCLALASPISATLISMAHPLPTA